MKEPVELTVNECLDLLEGGVVGRIAVATPLGPRIVPVNYAMYDGAVVFRTTPYSEIGTHGPRNEAAFEVDHLDYEHQQGWSVVALGRLEELGPEELDDLRKVWQPRPWAAGHRNLFLKLVWRELSGRRIGSDWSRSSMMPVRRVM
ncbi:pyridoxamine 5'-phosphate oxidase family protein [Nocardioides sp.]|uniref:pyridoxamine 5'-phosphate oxidase family protein n=1 Tax=Nocardioides sp. TaxID=35761 RepID=UPI002D80DDE7|nr:pyridoxamine 5'-phosphate oxidase family protein [Nocardioides sp.]HET8960046.1 pyridoxamine 5'-phosphate oxidase family protein [Nocardioides sp.]